MKYYVHQIITIICATHVVKRSLNLIEQLLTKYHFFLYKIGRFFVFTKNRNSLNRPLLFEKKIIYKFYLNLYNVFF